MSLKYNLSIHELMDFFCKDTHKGFSQQSIDKAEKNIGVSLPDVYREFLLTYGKDDINTFYNHIAPPEEIFTSYQAIMETHEELEEEYKEAIENGTQDEYEDNEYFELWQLPMEKWDTITKNYVLIWYENQGVWHAGYLLSDLQNGVKNPPVYISTDDDFITFEKFTSDTQEFLTEMLSHAAYGYFGRDSYQFYKQKDEIKAFCLQNEIDLTRLQNDCSGYYSGNCLDSEKEILYFYSENPNYQRQQLFVVYKNKQTIINNKKEEQILLKKNEEQVFPPKYSKAPYHIEISPSQKRCGFDQPPKENGFAIHFLVALALGQYYRNNLLVEYDWLRAISRVKRLELGLNWYIDRSYVEVMEDNIAYIKTPVNLPENFYWNVHDWSIIGKMTNLSMLGIECIYIEDFSFLKECKNIRALNLSQTNFSDCRIFLKMPNLKEVWLYNCALEHVEVLEKLNLKCHR